MLVLVKPPSVRDKIARKQNKKVSLLQSGPNGEYHYNVWLVRPLQRGRLLHGQGQRVARGGQRGQDRQAGAQQRHSFYILLWPSYRAEILFAQKVLK